MSNTVVMASDRNYLWGCFLLIASMRKSGMAEPALVAAYGFTDEDRACLEQLGGVQVICKDRTDDLTLACSKPLAMLDATTDFITWADCDGIFSGNCSSLLAQEPGIIHVRNRTPAETADVYQKFYRDGDEPGTVPQHILKTWANDLELPVEPRLTTVSSTCFLSVHKDSRPFLEKWAGQMRRVLPKGDVGVVDNRTVAYRQTDESVLNSILLLDPEAPTVSDTFLLDKDPAACYLHFVEHPKPWVQWNRQSWSYFDAVLDVVEWAGAQQFTMPTSPIPVALQRKYRTWNQFMSRVSKHTRRAKKLRKMLLGV